MSELSFRPGVLRGRYPQKNTTERSDLVKWAVSLLAKIKSIFHRNRYRQSYIVNQVNHYEEELKHLSEQDLTERINALRRQLQRHGLQEPLIVQSFALIREVAGRTLGKRHFDTQLFGGWIMINGMLAQMTTGEGKTLATALPACTAALAGIPVHVITANDYLAARDAQLLQPLYERLGLVAGAVLENMATDLRQTVYAGNIVHISNKQIAFDFLRDKIAITDDAGRLRLQFQQIQAEQFGSAKLLLRGLCFAIIKEGTSCACGTG